MSTPSSTPTQVEAVPAKAKQLATTVPAEFYAAIEAHHWDKRVKVSDIVREALEDYVAKHGIDVAGK